MDCPQRPSFQYQKGWSIDSQYKILKIFPISTLVEAPRALENSMTDSILFLLQDPHLTKLQSKGSLFLVWHHLPVLSWLPSNKPDPDTFRELYDRLLYSFLDNAFSKVILKTKCNE